VRPGGIVLGQIALDNFETESLNLLCVRETSFGQVSIRLCRAAVSSCIDALSSMTCSLLTWHGRELSASQAVQRERCKSTQRANRA